MVTPIRFIRFAEEGGEVEVALPAVYEVCPTCRGEGKTVNPAIDGDGITGEEWARDWDDDDREAYFRGDYDVPCRECGGKGLPEGSRCRQVTLEEQDVGERGDVGRHGAEHDPAAEAASQPVLRAPTLHRDHVVARCELDSERARGRSRPHVLEPRPAPHRHGEEADGSTGAQPLSASIPTFT